MEYKQIIVRGIVQGVGYRYFVQRTAERMGLKGYVRNQYDGSVEVVVQIGDSEDISSFVQKLKLGTQSAYIEGVEVSPFKYQGEFTHFDIKP
jgi:acylphosphatase